MIAFVLLAAAATGGTADRRVPFWGDEVPRAIAAEVDGVAVLETVRARMGPATYDVVSAVLPGDILAYECLNLVDGRRSVADIRDILTGR